MAVSESYVVKKIAKALRDRGAWVIKYHGSAYGVAGVPDLIGCYKGRFIAVEVKAPDGHHPVTALQWHQMALIDKAGGLVCVARKVPEAMALLDHIDELRGYSPPAGISMIEGQLEF